MTQEQLRNLNTIVEKYGADPQIDMAIEESSELIKALLKYRRKKNGSEVFDEKELRTAIIDEIADVSIMVMQLQIVFGCMEETEERIAYKIDRQMNRIKEQEVRRNACEVTGRNDSSE